MQDGHNSALADCIRHCGAEDVGLGEGDRTGILHSTSVEVWHPELVVLFEWVWEVKGLLKIGEAFFGLLKDVMRVHVLSQRAAAENPKWNGLTA